MEGQDLYSQFQIVIEHGYDDAHYNDDYQYHISRYLNIYWFCLFEFIISIHKIMN